MTCKAWQWGNMITPHPIVPPVVKIFLNNNEAPIMAFAPPVSRENFYYNGDLYVEVGALNRHKRATVEEITTLLRPDVKKSNKALANLPKDQVGHWYEAQLIHYGLPPSKDKARAKMRLLEAVNQSNLIVPRRITEMETQMKKEYAAADRKAKAQYKASQAVAGKSEPSAQGKKRKQTEVSGNINNININIGLGREFLQNLGGYNATDSHLPPKKAKTGTSKPAMTKAREVGIKQQLPQAPKTPKRQLARSSQLTQKWLKDPTIGPGPINSEGLRYYVTPSGTLGLQDPDLWHQSKIKKEANEQKSPEEKKPTARKEKVKKEFGAETEPKGKKEPKVKQDPDVKPSSQKKNKQNMDRSCIQNSPSLGLINGAYDISCPTVESEWSCTDLTLTLSLDGTTVWGAYDFGMFSGIMFLSNRPWQASGEPLPFTWRGRENGEGQMSFGPSCQGEIFFLGNGEIGGWIGVYGRCDFQGVRVAEAGTAVRSAGSMRAEWEGYNERAYEEERTGRWG